jgi:hypothetical protein
MRKGISTLFALVIMLSGAHISIATHYCGGKVAATKVSLSGKLASCGMEGTEKSCPMPGKHLSTHCCDNRIITIGIINNFTSPFPIITENTQNPQHILYLPVRQPFHSNVVFSNLYTSIRPPGKFLFSAVNLDDICVFRI